MRVAGRRVLDGGYLRGENEAIDARLNRSLRLSEALKNAADWVWFVMC
jgi:hypothetical protein